MEAEKFVVQSLCPYSPPLDTRRDGEGRPPRCWLRVVPTWEMQGRGEEPQGEVERS